MGSYFIDNENNKIDQAISLQMNQIEKLKEYKATLIDSAVTGKIKVKVATDHSTKNTNSQRLTIALTNLTTCDE